MYAWNSDWSTTNKYKLTLSTIPSPYLCWWPLNLTRGCIPVLEITYLRSRAGCLYAYTLVATTLICLETMEIWQLLVQSDRQLHFDSEDLSKGMRKFLLIFTWMPYNFAKFCFAAACHTNTEYTAVVPRAHLSRHVRSMSRCNFVRFDHRCN